MTPSLPPLALYVHYPWCLRKCPYCDFNSHALTAGVCHGDYVRALLADLDRDAERAGGRVLSTIFIGGGTPSLLEPAEVGRLIEGIHRRLPVAEDAEITLEANPGAGDTRRFAGYRAAGINRLSIGVQSLDDRLLQSLGRLHGRVEALRAVEAAGAAGFGRLNLDLMYGLPGQTPEGARADIEQAVALGPGHLSCYQLTLEPGTPFHARPPVLPGEETQEAIEQAVHGALTAAGYHRYEVSAWAVPGQECRHNLNYWTFGDYLGIGAGAHAKITRAGRPEAGGGHRLVITRHEKARRPGAYLAAAGSADGPEGRRRLTAAETDFEFMLNALRLTGGFAEALYTERTGRSLDRLARPLATAQRQGLLERRGGHCRPSAAGLRFLDDLTALFLPPPQSPPQLKQQYF